MPGPIDGWKARTTPNELVKRDYSVPARMAIAPNANAAALDFADIFAFLDAQLAMH